MCHSTKVNKNAHIQAYLGRKVLVDPATVPPHKHVVKGYVNTFCLPYEKFYEDPEQEETFKLLDNIVLHNKGYGYTCFVSAFCIFISDKEIRTLKSPVLKFFDNLDSA